MSTRTIAALAGAIALGCFLFTVPKTSGFVVFIFQIYYFLPWIALAVFSSRDRGDFKGPLRVTMFYAMLTAVGSGVAATLLSALPTEAKGDVLFRIMGFINFLRGTAILVFAAVVVTLLEKKEAPVAAIAPKPTALKTPERVCASDIDATSKRNAELIAAGKAAKAEAKPVPVPVEDDTLRLICPNCGVMVGSDNPTVRMYYNQLSRGAMIGSVGLPCHKCGVESNLVLWYEKSKHLNN